MEELDKRLNKVFNATVTCRPIGTNGIIEKISVTIVYEGGLFFVLKLSNQNDLQILFHATNRDRFFTEVAERIARLNSTFLGHHKEILDMISEYIGTHM